MKTIVTSPRKRRSVERASKTASCSQLSDATIVRPVLARGTFMTNHTQYTRARTAVTVPSMVLREVAIRVGITERAVQRIIRELEQAEYIVRGKIGRRNCYQVKSAKR